MRKRVLFLFSTEIGSTKMDAKEIIDKLCSMDSNRIRPKMSNSKKRNFALNELQSNFPELNDELYYNLFLMMLSHEEIPHPYSHMIICFKLPDYILNKHFALLLEDDDNEKIDEALFLLILCQTLNWDFINRYESYISQSLARMILSFHRHSHDLTLEQKIKLAKKHDLPYLDYIDE